MALLPFGKKALRHFQYLERPWSFDLEDAPGFELTSAATPNTEGEELVPRPQAFSTVGAPVPGIEGGVARRL